MKTYSWIIVVSKVLICLSKLDCQLDFSILLPLRRSLGATSMIVYQNDSEGIGIHDGLPHEMPEVPVQFVEVRKFKQ